MKVSDLEYQIIAYYGSNSPNNWKHEWRTFDLKPGTFSGYKTCLCLWRDNFYPKGANKTEKHCNSSLLNPLINMSRSVSQTVELVYINEHHDFRHHLELQSGWSFQVAVFFFYIYLSLTHIMFRISIIRGKRVFMLAMFIIA